VFLVSESYPLPHGALTGLLLRPVTFSQTLGASDQSLRTLVNDTVGVTESPLKRRKPAANKKENVMSYESGRLLRVKRFFRWLSLSLKAKLNPLKLCRVDGR
jgi:hypothetical protein